MPTTNVLRIMVLRSATITSWLEKGNHGDTTISRPSSMPNQSSHVRCLLKKPKPDIVDLPLKRGIRRRPRSQHYRYRTRPGRVGAVCHPKDVGTLPPVARPGLQRSREGTPGTQPYCAAPSRFRPSLAVRSPGLISSALRKSAIAPALSPSRILAWPRLFQE